MRRSENRLQGEAYGRGKAFVDIEIKSSDYQLYSRAATVMGGTYNEMSSKTFSATLRPISYSLHVPTDPVFQRPRGPHNANYIVKLPWSSNMTSDFLPDTHAPISTLSQNEYCI